VDVALLSAPRTILVRVFGNGFRVTAQDGRPIAERFLVRHLAGHFRAAFGVVLAALLKKCEPGYRAWAYATLALVYHEMMAQFPHRSRAVREAIWKADHTGSVRCVNGKWWWFTHWSSVKNGRSSDNFKDYEWHEAELKDVNGLYAALHDYTRERGARDWILNGRSSDCFFVLNSDRPEMDASQLYARVKRSTRTVLARIDDPRWSDMRDFGPHAERKLVFNALCGPADAPDAIEMFARACDALLIGPGTATTYYLFAPPGERSVAIGEQLKRERDKRS
jgi:hypothetical protein